MKKVLTVLSLIIINLLLSGCGKNYTKLSYTDYNEYFNSKEGYIVIDKSSNYDTDIVRYLEAGDGEVQVFYIEFEKTKDAISYINDLYGDSYKIKTKNNYSTIKSSKEKYFRLIRIDNVIVTAVADKEYKKDIKNILKDLGF